MLTLESLFRYFQEAAWSHAERLGLGYTHLRKRNHAWVLSRMTVAAESYPEWGQPVVVRTWPRGSNGLLALRDFELADRAGRRLAGATSGWIVLDLASRRPQRIEPILGSIRVFPERRAAGGDAEKLALAGEPSQSVCSAVKYSDLDLNDHVDNTTYVRWLLDSYPVDFHRAHQVRRLALNFLAEVGPNDSIVLGTREVEPLRFRHDIRRQGDGAEACRAEAVGPAGDRPRQHSDIARFQ